ncbi:extracellular solute-binding protein [Paenibacillus sp. GCM10023252]|uniref:extracellular solute-binding protein n=1 Tax=Paenibacillus sp. GCM10023252 TaxID=3252649 RepID=UPI00362421C1
MKRGHYQGVTAVLAVMLLSACTGGNNAEDTSNQVSPKPDSEGAAKQEAPAEISIFTNQQTPEVLPENNPVLQEIEKRTNTKLNIIWTPVNTLQEKTKLTLASGDIPDLMLIGSTTDAQFTTMAKQGAFWDLEPYVQDYPNMKALPKLIWDNARTGGKIYGLPRVRPTDGGGDLPMLRKDWVEKLGLKMPETIEELYETAKAFSEKDPDGNGTDDTFGITGQVNLDNMGNLAWVEKIYTGVPGSWKDIDGKLTPSVELPEMKDALAWLNRAYKDKVLVQDFAVLQYSQSRDLLMGGKAGMIGTAINPQWLFTEALRKIDPNALMYPLPYVTGPHGKFAGKDSGVLGIYAIPKTVSEEKLKKILAFMDYGYGTEGSELANYGLPEVHYKDDNGFKVATEQAKTDFVGQNYLGQIYGEFVKHQRAFLPGIPREMYDQNTAVIDQRAEISVLDPAYNLVSDTAVKYGADYAKKIQDMKTKVIMGKEPLEAWDTFVEGLKKDPTFQKMTEEMNAARAAR